MHDFVFENALSIITSLFGAGGVYAYYSERKKRKIEEKQLSADALQKMQEAYDRFTSDQTKRYVELSEEISVLKKKYAELQTEVEEKDEKYTLLKRAYDILKTEHDKLKKAFEALKKKYGKSE